MTMWVVGHLNDALRKKVTARMMSTTAHLDAMMRQHGVTQACERAEMSTPHDGPHEALGRLRSRLARLTFELFVPARLDAIDPESRHIAGADKRAAIAALHEYQPARILGTRDRGRERQPPRCDRSFRTSSSERASALRRVRRRPARHGSAVNPRFAAAVVRAGGGTHTRPLVGRAM